MVTRDATRRTAGFRPYLCRQTLTATSHVATTRSSTRAADNRRKPPDRRRVVDGQHQHEGHHKYHIDDEQCRGSAGLWDNASLLVQQKYHFRLTHGEPRETCCPEHTRTSSTPSDSITSTKFSNVTSSAALSSRPGGTNAMADLTHSGTGKRFPARILTTPT